MVTRVRIDAMGASAAEVEKHLHAIANVIAETVGEGVPHLGQQLISRADSESVGHTAHEGRLLVYLNTADDAPQVTWLTERTGECRTGHGLPRGPGQRMGTALGYEEVAEGFSGGAEDGVTAGP